MKFLLFFVMGAMVGYILGRVLPRKASKVPKTDSFNVTDEMIIRFANLRKGIISANELSSQTSLNPDEAQQRLEKLVSKQIAELRVSETGQILYDFTKNQPDLLEKIKSEKL
ncbi:hypothetical protein [Raineya orbicola]|jgi:hypothetical protein|uniref:Uncharacterized protein n=1 Tax=Raineya orbicola TaxID=2016530 RepID=A0A2N3IG73_9BACT|nr:hypothetical protein [Raineya orbicola]PKQ69287.1 hypothetical protein Rain11_1440 [Raineya orbicola]